VKRLKVKVVTGPNVVEDALFGPFCHHRTLSDDSLNWFRCVISGSAILGTTMKKVKVINRPNIVQKDGGMCIDSSLLTAV